MQIGARYSKGMQKQITISFELAQIGWRLSWQGELDALKESIVRVHVRSAAPLAADFTVPNALSVHREERYASAVIFDWKPYLHQDMERRLGAPVEIESLGLEDIFLELHR